MIPPQFKPFTVGDLFCGAGGSSQGAVMSGVAKVVFCINHDPKAIRCHAENHPDCVHYTEDIRTFNEMCLPKVDVLTVSAECTHFSIAKGGQPRDADSRTLSEHVIRYVVHCAPDIIIVENVKEFLTWGDLKQKVVKGVPQFRPDGSPYLVPDTDKQKQGAKYREWVNSIKALGYEYSYRILNSADFGAHTSRRRYFGIFAKAGKKIAFPKQTHAKNAPAGSGYERWKPASEVLDLGTLGESIFARKKPLSENTLKRIYAGLQKFVPAAQDKWVVKFLSNNQHTGTNRGASLEEPIHTITTQGRFALAKVQFLDDYKSREDATYSLEKPLPVIDTLGNKSIVQAAFLDKYYGRSNVSSIDVPVPTITTVDRFACVHTEHSEAPQVSILPIDSPYTRKIKEFMLEHSIADVYMRMLTVEELKRAQGFPDAYKLSGNQRDDKKFIGNSVVPVMMQKIIEALYTVNI